MVSQWEHDFVWGWKKHALQALCNVFITDSREELESQSTLAFEGIVASVLSNSILSTTLCQ